MFYVGRHQNSRILMALFTVWIFLPFAVLLWSADFTKRSWLAPLITGFSLAIYGYTAFGPPTPKPAAMFLAVPAASLLLLALTFGLNRKS